MQDLTALEGKTIVELREIAKVLGITPSNMKKGELINKIVEATTTEPTTPAPEPADAPKRGRRPRMNSIKVGASPQPRQEVMAEDVPAEASIVEQVAETPAQPAEQATAQPQPKRRGRKPKRSNNQHAEPAPEPQPAEEEVNEINIDEELPIEHISLHDIISDDDDEVLDVEELFDNDNDDEDG